MIAKTNYYRSSKHLRNVASLPCMHCGMIGSTQASHSNQAIHGKGRGIKASDEYTAALCADHHYEVDQGRSMSRSERVAMWESAHARTVEALKERGLWPGDVPVPCG